jgi:hypothetical protein
MLDKRRVLQRSGSMGHWSHALTFVALHSDDTRRPIRDLRGGVPVQYLSVLPKIRPDSARERMLSFR